MNIVCAYNYETIKDPRLREATRVIRNSCECITEHSFAIAAMIAKVEDNDLLSNDDFVDICDYVKRCFGFEKTTAYNLLKVGREFIQIFEDGTIETVLAYTKKDYTISQVVKMLPLGVDRAKELTSDGVITSDMSCRQIERIVKANMKRMIVDDPEDQDDPEDRDDSEDPEVSCNTEVERVERCELCKYYRRLKHNFVANEGFEESHACVAFLYIEECPTYDQWVQEVDPRDMCEYFTGRGDNE